MRTIPQGRPGHFFADASCFLASGLHGFQCFSMQVWDAGKPLRRSCPDLRGVLPGVLICEVRDQRLAESRVVLVSGILHHHRNILRLVLHDWDSHSIPGVSHCRGVWKARLHIFALACTVNMHIFCVRYRQKCQCLRDRWFVFDAMLVCLMVALSVLCTSAEAL